MLDKKTATGCADHDYCAGWNDAVDAMHRWIPVEERLPEMGEPVIVCRKHKGNTLKIEQGNRQVNGWWKVYGANVKTVTHWKPLPKPPEK